MITPFVIPAFGGMVGMGRIGYYLREYVFKKNRSFGVVYLYSYHLLSFEATSRGNHTGSPKRAE